MQLFFPPQKWTYGQRIIEYRTRGNEFNPECYVKMTLKKANSICFSEEKYIFIFVAFIFKFDAIT